MEKAELRAQMVQRLKAFSAQEPERKKISELKLCQRICQTAAFQQAQVVALTYALPYEVDTTLLQRACAQAQKTVVMPVSLPQRKLAFYAVDLEEPSVLTRFGVAEPQIANKKPVLPTAIDLVVVPGLVFQAEGYRIGFGGGFYDRFLHEYSGHTVSQAFCFQQDETWQPEVHDTPVQQVIFEGWEKHENQ